MPVGTENGGPTAVHRLTPEILARIFCASLELELANDPDRNRWHYGFGKSPTAPLVVSSVCGQWRQVALDTNAIWSVIYYGFHQNIKKWDSVPRVRLWLQRSKGVDVDLRLTCGRPDAERLPVKKTKQANTPAEEEAISFVEEIISGQLQRSKFLRLSVTDADAVHRILTTLKANPSSCIRQVELSTPRTIPGSPYLKNMFDGLWPSLRHIHLHKIPIELPTSVLKALRHIHLEEMTVTRICTDEFLLMLQGCADLEELHLHHMWPDEGSGFEDEEEDEDNDVDPDCEDEEDGEDRQEELIDLPKLSSLSLTMLPMAWVRKLTSKLAAPALRTLEVSQFYPNDPENPMDDGAQSCIRGLKKLDMSHVESFKWLIEEEPDLTSKSDVAWLLSHLPALRVLDIENCSECVDDFVNVLYEDVASPTCPHRLCPKLNSLKGCSLTPTLMKLLNMRKTSTRVTPIRRLYVGKDAKISDDLKKLVDEVVME